MNLHVLVCVRTHAGIYVHKCAYMLACKNKYLNQWVPSSSNMPMHISLGLNIQHVSALCATQVAYICSSGG